MLKARHAAERLQGAWHGGMSTIDQLRAGMQDTLAEFALSRDEAEVPLMVLSFWSFQLLPCFRCLHTQTHRWCPKFD